MNRDELIRSRTFSPASTTVYTAAREADRARISAEIDEYLANGGVITDLGGAVIRSKSEFKELQKTWRHTPDSLAAQMSKKYLNRTEK